MGDGLSLTRSYCEDRLPNHNQEGRLQCKAFKTTRGLPASATRLLGIKVTILLQHVINRLGNLTGNLNPCRLGSFSGPQALSAVFPLRHFAGGMHRSFNQRPSQPAGALLGQPTIENMLGGGAYRWHQARKGAQGFSAFEPLDIADLR